MPRRIHGSQFMDKPTFSTLLQAELDIPAGLRPSERVDALEAAFRTRNGCAYSTPFEASGESALAYISEGDDLDFYGTVTLHAAFGSSLDIEYPEVAHLRPRGEEWMAGLRRRAYRYAVVAYESHTLHQRRTERAVSIALRHTPRLLYRESTGLLDGCVETLKLRDGLMNKRQAKLLAEHLNSTQGRPSHRVNSAWRVVEGPKPDGDARVWLDGLGAVGRHLRRESGETAAWGLGDAATRGIATFQIENSDARSSRSAFSAMPPRIALPPRFLLDCVSPEGATCFMAADHYSSVGIRRLHPAADATKLFELVTASNLQPGESRAHHSESPLQGFFHDWRPRHEDCSEYALGFADEDAEQVKNFLSSSGYGTFDAVRIGRGGDFNPLGYEDIVRKSALLIPGQTALHVEFFSYRG